MNQMAIIPVVDVHVPKRGTSWGQSYKANFGLNYTKNGLNKLNFTLNYINFDVIYAKKVL